MEWQTHSEQLGSILEIIRVSQYVVLFGDPELYSVGKVSDTILQLMDVPRCGDTDDKKDGKGSRQKRWTKLGTTVWTAALMPLQISVANGVRGFSVSDVESIALDCARVSVWCCALDMMKYFPIGAEVNYAHNRIKNSI